MSTSRVLLLMVAVLLQGCPLGDNFSIYRANLSVVDNKICITINPQGGERIVSLDISDGSTDQSLLRKLDISLPISANQCAPDFGFSFEMGKPYHYSLFVEPDSGKRRGGDRLIRSFVATFTLRDNNGELEFTTTNWCNSSPKGISDAWRKQCLIE